MQRTPSRKPDTAVEVVVTQPSAKHVEHATDRLADLLADLFVRGLVPDGERGCPAASAPRNMGRSCDDKR